MLNLLKAVLSMSAVTLVFSCSKEPAEVAGSESSAESLATTPRSYLFSMRVKGYAPFEARVTSLDAGVQKNAQGQCEFLKPLNADVASRTAAPLHLYSNITSDDDANVVLDPEVVFDGDTGSFRHGDKALDYKNTRSPELEGVTIRLLKAVSAQELLYYIKMDRENYLFQTYLSVRTDKDVCSAAASICSNPDVASTGKCAVPETSPQIHGITVYLDLQKYLLGEPITKVSAETTVSGKSDEYVFKNEKTK